MRDIDADRLTAHATRIALDAQALAAEALRVRDEQRHAVDALREQLARAQDEIEELKACVEGAERTVQWYMERAEKAEKAAQAPRLTDTEGGP